MLSPSVSSEELDILPLLLLSVQGSHGSSRPCKLLQFSPFSLILSLFRNPHPWGGSLLLHISFPSILTLHLLIVQAITRVLVPSATFPNPLWVAATKATLFRGPFIINAARTLVGRIKCRGDSFSLNCSYTMPPCASYYTRPFFGEHSGRLPLMACRSFLLESGMPRTKSSSATSLGHLDFHYMSSDISLLSTGLRPSTKWAEVAKFSGPTITLHVFSCFFFLGDLDIFKLFLY